MTHVSLADAPNMEPTVRELAEDLDEQYQIAADGYRRALVSSHNALLLSRGIPV